MEIAGPDERPSKIRKLDLEEIAQNRRYDVASAQAQVGLTYWNDREKINSNAVEAPDPAFHDAEEILSTLDTEATVQDLYNSKSLSKSQLKKLRKKQEWEAGRESRKLKRKEKGKEKKARKAEIRAKDNQEDMDKAIPSSEPVKKHHQRPIQVPIAFVLDCGFDDLMTDGELTSLSSQLTRCYSDNKNAPYRAHMVISSFGGKLKHRFETVLHNNQLGWKGVRFTELDFVNAAREADATMRDKQGGRLVGALAGADPLHMTANEPGKYAPSTRLAGSESTAYASTVASDSYHQALSAVTSRAATSPDNVAPLHKPSQRKNEETKGSISTNGTNIPSTSTLCSKPEAETTSPIEVHPADAIPPPLRPHTTPSSNTSIVYLTSDSPNVLDVLSPYTTYIVGGIVDKNRHKGLCYKRACERGIPTAKLPIGEYMIIQSRTVLATNHVVEIMLRWLEDGDWGKAFMRVIPKRKEARLKGLSENMSTEEREEDDSRSNVSVDEGARIDGGRSLT